MRAGALDQRDGGAAAPAEAMAQAGGEFQSRCTAADHDDAVRFRRITTLAVDGVRHCFTPGFPQGSKYTPYGPVQPVAACLTPTRKRTRRSRPPPSPCAPP